MLQRSTTPAPSSAAWDETLSVAVVESDRSAQLELTEKLHEAGLRAHPFEKADHVAEAVESGQRFAVVLLDLGTPSGEHLPALRRIFEAAPKSAVLGACAEAVTSEIAGFMNAGGSDVVSKPVGDEGVARVLAALPTVAVRRKVPSVVVPGTLGDVFEQVDQIASSGATTLLLGETGVGKGLVARALHDRSPRADRPFVKVLCSAIPGTLLETELFGHARGAFTGADREKAGKLELAHRGTLFLDEIGELDLALQPKLLHALEHGEFTRVGSNRARRADVQLICATNRDLKEEVDAGRFREDLYHRINVLRIDIPPLRDRREEILPLFEAFVAHWGEVLDARTTCPTETLRALLHNYGFPGNTRELENLACRFAILGETASLHELLLARGAAVENKIETILQSALSQRRCEASLLEIGRQVSDVVERELVEHALATTGWNRRRAAQLLRLSYGTLLQKIQDFGLAPPGPHA